MKTRWLAVVLFLIVASWSSRALADATITGTVGEIGEGPYSFDGNAPQSIIRFKMTDPNQTKLCSPGNGNTLVGYAWFIAGWNNNNAASFWREWYASLLVSKKGAPISCTVDSNTHCQVTSCTLL